MNVMIISRDQKNAMCLMQPLNKNGKPFFVVVK